ncbi:hypothetical protein Cgig2_025459 [Carnegiea gigantea]|uniref:Uncharacterized protein n=1 Tax=Carnegiea gigantea TaxID=171969 RepID=A0A9Q1GT94_9CARY|nr:hypothetical protein Cgig2_025459 [Carnegiea gigantea]
MFRSKITLEEYLKSVQHEDAVGEDVSLNNIDMIPDFDEEEVEHVGENIFESRVSINTNLFLINIPHDFKDDKDGCFRSGISEATVPAETFAYHKLMGPESDDIKENQRNNTPLASEPLRDTSITTPTSAKNNEAYIKDVGQIENTTILRDKGGAAHTFRWSHVPNQSGDQNTSMGENTNASAGCSNQSNIARRLNFDQREQHETVIDKAVGGGTELQIEYEDSEAKMKTPGESDEEDKLQKGKTRELGKSHMQCQMSSQ